MDCPAFSSSSTQMPTTLTTVDCPADLKDLRDRLDRLYGRLGEIAESRLSFGGFVRQGDLCEKFHMRTEDYPRLAMSFSGADRDVLTSYAKMGPKDMLACAKTPLERLAIAALWKQADLRKVRHIAAGIVENSLEARSSCTVADAPVFRQFGRHLADPANQPIADQHTLRAYRYHLGRDLDDGRHRLNTVKAEEVENYVKWVGGLAAHEPSAGHADRMYEFDRSMFALGKATKAFIAAALTRPSSGRKIQHEPRR